MISSTAFLSFSSPSVSFVLEIFLIFPQNIDN
jgi:hypothetical protein